MAKLYDEAYFQRWYRDTRQRVKLPGELQRKVRMALSVAEYHLGHEVRSVLDVGCGEGAWLAPLRALRPDVEYLGLDGSEYAVQRYGRTRNLRLCRFAQLAEQRFGAPVDLLVCSDVMHYLSSEELRRGVSGFAALCDGVAFLDVLCKGDDFIGDNDGFVARPAAWYRKTFAAAGWTSVGSYCYLGPRLREDATSLELS